MGDNVYFNEDTSENFYAGGDPVSPFYAGISGPPVSYTHLTGNFYMEVDYTLYNSAGQAISTVWKALKKCRKLRMN